MHRESLLRGVMIYIPLPCQMVSGAPKIPWRRCLHILLIPREVIHLPEEVLNHPRTLIIVMVLSHLCTSMGLLTYPPQSLPAPTIHFFSIPFPTPSLCYLPPQFRIQHKYDVQRTHSPHFYAETPINPNLSWGMID